MTNDSNKCILSASEFITEVRILTRWEWLMSIISALGKLRQEGYSTLEATLDYIISSRLIWAINYYLDLKKLNKKQNQNTAKQNKE